MSYFNPEIYNYEALKPEHKRVIDIYDMAVEDALNRDFIIEDKMGLCLMEDESIIGRMKREIAEEVFNCLEDYMKCRRMEMIVALMDGDEDYCEKDPEEESEKDPEEETEA